MKPKDKPKPKTSVSVVKLQKTLTDRKKKMDKLLKET